MGHFVMGHRRNPELPGGIDIEDAGATAVGLSATALINDKIFAPLIDKFVPTLDNSHVVRKLVDAATTLGTAFLYRMAIDPLSVRWGKWGQLGGSALGVSRAISAGIPSWQISSTTPVDSSIGGLFGLNRVAASSVGALPVGGSSQVSPAITGIPTEVTAAYAIGGPAYSLKGGA